MVLRMNCNNSHMTILVRNEKSDDHDEIEALGDLVFGPGRFTRSAFRLREGVAPETHLSFVAMHNDKIIGSNRLTKIMIGDQPALLLGSLMVDPSLRGLGIGRDLMNRCLLQAKTVGHKYVILVGDLAYYKEFGFNPIKQGQITLPGPVDPMRLLGCSLGVNISNHYEGRARASIA